MAENAENDDESIFDGKGWEIFLSVLWRVVKNPIVWACVFGVIMNQAVLAPGGTFPTWFARFFRLGSQCTLPLSMFLTGVFTATYDPIHLNVMRFICCVTTPCHRLCCPKLSYSPSASTLFTAGSRPGSDYRYETDSMVLSSSASASSLAAAAAASGQYQLIGKESGVTKMRPLIGSASAPHLRGGKEDAEGRPTLKEVEEGHVSVADPTSATNTPVSSPLASFSSADPSTATSSSSTITAAATSSTLATATASTASLHGAGAGPDGKARKRRRRKRNSEDYKFNWWLTIAEIVLRHFVSPALMLVLCLVFGNTLSTIQKHALILMSSLGTPEVVFSISRLHNAYPGEAAITQVIGAFALTLPVYLLFYYIANAVFPQ